MSLDIFNDQAEQSRIYVNLILKRSDAKCLIYYTEKKAHQEAWRTIQVYIKLTRKSRALEAQYEEIEGNQDFCTVVRFAVMITIIQLKQANKLDEVPANYVI